MRPAKPSKAGHSTLIINAPNSDTSNSSSPFSSSASSNKLQSLENFITPTPGNEQKMGSENLQTLLIKADLLHNEGNAEYEKGNYRKAQALFKQSLAIRELHQKNSIPLANTLTQLAICLGHLGDARQGAKLFERALAINECHYDKDHPQIAQSLVNLGCAYGTVKNLPQAEIRLGQALATSERLYGKDSIQVASILMNIVAYEIYKDAKKNKEVLQQQVLPIYQSKYGKDNIHTGIALANLGNAHKNLGETKEAAELLGKALAIITQNLGVENPITIQTLHHFNELRNTRNSQKNEPPSPSAKPNTPRR